MSCRNIEHCFKVSLIPCRKLLVTETERITNVCNKWEEKLNANAHLIDEEIQVGPDGTHRVIYLRIPILLEVTYIIFTCQSLFNSGFDPLDGWSGQTGHG